MKKHLYLLLAVLSAPCFLLWLSCQKSAAPAQPLPTPPEYITANVEGRIVNESRIPVSGALVKAGTATTTTDINGSFSFSGVQLDKNTGFVVVEKTGYFNGSRTFRVNPSAFNHIEIQLIPKTVAGTFAAASGGNISVPSLGGSIVFPAGGVINVSNNAVYTGVVSVAAFYLNPSSPDFGAYMPGALRGLTTSNEERGLQSFGMMAVELTGAGGEKLQLAGGKTATITFPVTTGLQASAPASIPLWYFDEADGLWKEEGSATKQGNNYVGVVKHFSFWNCDAPFTVVDFEAILKDQAGNVLPNAKVIIKTTGDTVSISGMGYTDASGKVSGKIPMNKSLLMQVFNKCGVVIHTQNIGPFAGATNLGTVTINVTASAPVTISGTVINCTGQPVTNGFVNVLLDGFNNRVSINNGNFSLTITRCAGTAANASIIATDIGATQQGNPINVNVTTGTVNAGSLSACGVSISQYLNYTINGNSYGFTSPADSLMAGVSNAATLVSGFTRSSSNNIVNLSFNGVSTGTFAINYIAVHPPSGGTYVKNGTLNVNVTEHGPVGTYITGSFSGTLRDTLQTSNVVPFNCTFRVKRSY